VTISATTTTSSKEKACWVRMPQHLQNFGQMVELVKWKDVVASVRKLRTRISPHKKSVQRSNPYIGKVGNSLRQTVTLALPIRVFY
jgi:hypothetical protein